jgi:hypothetical protein
MNKKMGRPRLEKGKAKGVLIGARFSPDEAKRVNATAEKYEHGKSEWIRRTLLSATE